jgi:hypothetical protein
VDNDVILSGPFGIGKSTTLIPLVADRLRRVNLSVGTVSGLQRLTIVDYITILDEAGILNSADQGELRELIQTAKNNGRRVVPVIAHGVEQSPDSSIRIWKTVFDKTKPRSSVDHIQLNALRLNPSDAWNYMKFDINKNYNDKIDDRWKFIADQFPGALPLLRNLADYCYFDGEAPSTFMVNLRNCIDLHFNHGTISRAEYRSAEQAIRETRRRI